MPYRVVNTSPASRVKACELPHKVELVLSMIASTTIAIAIEI